MKGTPAIYLGQIVSKDHFRVFIYAPDGSQKLVNSWDEFEKHMETGLWFATKEDAVTRIPVEKPKRVRKPVAEVTFKSKEEPKEEPFFEEELIDVPPEEAAFEVNANDDFLPKSRK